MRAQTLLASTVALVLMLPVGCSSSSGHSGSTSSASTGGTAGSGGNGSAGGSAGSTGSPTGGSSSGGGGTTTGGTSACTDLATAFCDLQNSCSNGFLVARNWGDLSTCVSLQAQQCLLSISAPSSSRTPEKVEACALAYPGTSCGDLFAGLLPTACIPAPGGLAEGAACTVSGQCQSAYCAVPSTGTVCGTCQPLPESDAGVSCDTLDCPRGLVCSKSNVCLAPVGDGGACSDPGQCFFDLVCEGLDLATTTPGVCVPAAATLGATCDPQALTAPSCATRLGLQCNGRSSTCAATLLADAGDPCGAIDAGPRPCPDGGTVCVLNGQINCLGGVCVEEGGVASCLAGAMPGQVCDLSAGPACISPGNCVVDAGTTGVCRLADPSLCGP